MKNKILIILGALLLLSTVACANLTPYPWSSMVLADSPPSESSNIMTVFYTIEDEEYLFWCDLSADITDNGDGTWTVIAPQVTASGLSQSYATYGYYQYRELEFSYDHDGQPLPTYMADHNLQPVTANDLPKSQHIGKLTAVDAGLARPATVARKWHGVTYEVQCLVSQSVVDMWQAGTLLVNDYVIVSFIEEIPDTTEVNIAIVVDKVYESWGS